MIKRFTDHSQLPAVMSAADIAAYLGISRANAYSLLHAKDFPTMRIGKRMMVSKDKMLDWVDRKSGEESQ